MSDARFPAFPDFFAALWKKEPFPWQAMLAERVASQGWPQALDLPTASGKTAAIEVALFALACQADRPWGQRTAPRRVWFVVDRRIVVDEALARAEVVAARLAGATEGPVFEVAQRLRQLAGTERPLAVGRLRGGVLRDDGWARLPSQPAVIASTVDQLGSRLFFRGYGHSGRTAPVYAGLAVHDSLVLLDEAHCSVPFLQSLRAVEAYRAGGWTEAGLATPFAFVIMSATPPGDLPDEGVFPGRQRQAALDHPVLRQRLQAAKPAELVVVKTRKRQAKVDALVAEAVRRAGGLLHDGRLRVAVMVNRVRTACEVASILQAEVGATADVVLMTGRMRPYERDQVVARWKPFLRADRPQTPKRPVVVVATQCLEVGADFSFDALVTEAASLDALRQRFGRLDRMGTRGEAQAAILIRDTDTDPATAEPDPVYGPALARTWQVLTEHAGDARGRVIDLGVEAADRWLAAVEDLTSCLAPRPDAPVLLPAHLDLLCQTAPTPHPDLDVSLFLHGKGRGAPEAQVVWRADLPVAEKQVWPEILALCPPASGEMLSVPLYRLRAWLNASTAIDEGADVEGIPGTENGPDEADAASRGRGPRRSFLLWRGRDDTRVTGDHEEIQPGDVVVVPAGYGMDGLGQGTEQEGLGETGLDLWERVSHAAGRPTAVRLQRHLLKPWLDLCRPLADLLALAETPAWERQDLDSALDAILEVATDGDATAPLPSWWCELLRQARGGECETHPAGGLILRARSASSQVGEEPDLFADDDDLTSVAPGEVTLEEHTDLMVRSVGRLAGRCVPPELVPALELAARWHDAGKLDERFQLLLHQGDELAALGAPAPLAKSATLALSPGGRRAIRAASGLPQGFRHELASMQVAQACACLPRDGELADLVLHLIASHHGQGRPFAAVVLDPNPPSIEGRNGEHAVHLAGATRRARPAHRLDSGVSQRFWRLTRRYGWWGLAYLEAVFRLSDWYASSVMPRAELEGTGASAGPISRDLGVPA